MIDEDIYAEDASVKGPAIRATFARVVADTLSVPLTHETEIAANLLILNLLKAGLVVVNLPQGVAEKIVEQPREVLLANAKALAGEPDEQPENTASVDKAG